MKEMKSIGRIPNDIEQDVIERCVENTKEGYIGMFVFFGILDLALWILIVLILTELSFSGFFIAIILFILALLILLFELTLYQELKSLSKLKKDKRFEILSDKGTWTIKEEGTGKMRQNVSIVNGKKLKMLAPYFYAGPTKVGDCKEILYEYVEIIDAPIVGGCEGWFISINGRVLEQKHKDYIAKLKPIGILSIVSSIVFLGSIFFIQFNSWLINLVSVLTFLVFFRTILCWIVNYNLRLGLDEGRVE